MMNILSPILKSWPVIGDLFSRLAILERGGLQMPRAPVVALGVGCAMIVQRLSVPIPGVCEAKG